MRETEVSMQLDVASCNPSWFACNIFICRKSTACAFICQCHWGSFSAPSLWILSCTLDENIAQAPLHCWHRHLFYLVLIELLLPLLRGISPVYSTEHIPKYSSVENFMKLPFQRVSFALNGVQTRELCTFHFWRCVLSRNFQSAQPSMFWPYPLVGISDWLGSWFVGTGTSWSFWISKKYAAFCFWGWAEYWW